MLGTQGQGGRGRAVKGTTSVWWGMEQGGVRPFKKEGRRQAKVRKKKQRKGKGKEKETRRSMQKAKRCFYVLRFSWKLKEARFCFLFVFGEGKASKKFSSFSAVVSF